MLSLKLSPFGPLGNQLQSSQKTSTVHFSGIREGITQYLIQLEPEQRQEIAQNLGLPKRASISAICDRIFPRLGLNREQRTLNSMYDVLALMAHPLPDSPDIAPTADVQAMAQLKVKELVITIINLAQSFPNWAKA